VAIFGSEDGKVRLFPPRVVHIICSYVYEDKIKTTKNTTLIVLFKHMEFQRPGCTHPVRQSRVVLERVTGVWVDEDAEGFQSIGYLARR
jgi:hypothetical protein